MYNFLFLFLFLILTYKVLGYAVTFSNIFFLLLLFLFLFLSPHMLLAFLVPFHSWQPLIYLDAMHVKLTSAPSSRALPLFSWSPFLTSINTESQSPP